MLGWLIALFQLRKPASNRCCTCGLIGPTCCLPFLGARKFCGRCAMKIMR